MEDTSEVDLRPGSPVRNLPGAKSVLGHPEGEQVLVTRRGEEYFAGGAFRTHYHGPLAEGLVVEDSVRCPRNHACFSLRTGKVLRAPVCEPIPCWKVRREGDTVFIGEK